MTTASTTAFASGYNASNSERSMCGLHKISAALRPESRESSALNVCTEVNIPLAKAQVTTLDARGYASRSTRMRYVRVR